MNDKAVMNDMLSESYGVRLDATVVGVGGGGVWCRFGLKMSTRMRPKMMSKSRKMHFRRPVFC